MVSFRSRFASCPAYAGRHGRRHPHPVRHRAPATPTPRSELLPLVYDELRKLAAAELAQEKPGQTLQATALVHEAYLRLVGGEPDAHWNSRGHFFAAAAEAMRRILVENARRKKTEKRGGERQRIDLSRPSRSTRPTRTPSWTWTSC